MPARRRIWCETLPHDELVAPAVVRLLGRSGVAPIVAVWPDTTAPMIARILERFGEAGLRVTLWPMLADRDGRWVNAENVDAVAAFVLDRLDAVLRLGAPAPEAVAIDLEPAIERVSPARAARRAGAREGKPSAPHGYALRPTDRRAFLHAKERLLALEAELHARGVAISAAIVPSVLLDAPPNGGVGRPASPAQTGWQEALGTPVDGVAWDRVSVMLYASILEGWSGGVLRRQDVRSLLVTTSRAAAVRFGARAGVSLGLVGPGALKDEPLYRGPDELADDVALVTASGVDELALFDLGGVVRSGDPSAWLEAFAARPATSPLPEPTLRVRAVLATARAAGGVFGALGWLRNAAARAGNG